MCTLSGATRSAIQFDLFQESTEQLRRSDFVAGGSVLSLLRTFNPRARRVQMVAMAPASAAQHTTSMGGGAPSSRSSSSWALAPKASASPGARRASPIRPVGAIGKHCSATKRNHLALAVRVRPPSPPRPRLPFAHCIAATPLCGEPRLTRRAPCRHYRRIPRYLTTPRVPPTARLPTAPSRARRRRRRRPPTATRRS